MPLCHRKQTSLFGAAFTAALAFFAAPGSSEGQWQTDFEVAKKQATSRGKDLFVNFTGSDWCGFCIAIKEQIFTQKVFLEGVRDNFILVEIDFPQSREQDEALKEQNERLRVSFGVEGFPTLFLVDSNGKPYGHIPNQPGITPGQFVAQMESHRGLRIKRDEKFAEADHKKELDRAKSLHAGLEILDDEIVDRFYGDIIDEIVLLDKKDTLKRAAGRTFEKSMGKLREEITALARDGDHDAIEKKIDSFVSEKKLKKEQKQAALMLKLGIFGPDQLDEVIIFLAEVVKLNPESRQGREAEEIRGRVEQFRRERRAREAAGS